MAFLEAAGYIAAFDAAEAMSKAAAVSLGGLTKLGGGLVAVSVLGGLADVLEAIEVGEETVRATHQVEVRSVVFARPVAAVAAVARRPQLVGS
ncbi:BMC domain-containing protein [Actinoplanes sp. Pm04-4]|uniref:BMC domain-containing protein n=1 Tax=Paractinoplanes pyxinae TaxID=2997416 RepID=A0ABT4BDF3_9ACTN|nr:BMC domain-containing protein [Actinoplanes pyxinae]MCY1143638.1 BMC domain-containing protein [Actinoplanes pyxinae]